MLRFEHPPDISFAPTDDLMLSIRFDQGCWILDSRRRFETLVYPSGGAAENAARTLAARLARFGQKVRVFVEDNRHALVGTRTYFPCDQSRPVAPSDRRTGA